MITTTFLLSAALVLPQDDAAAAPAAEASAPVAVETSAEQLRARIREMRMNLLLGGDQVREAEREAATFYTQKGQSVDRLMDGVATELSEVRASYDVTLDRALDGRGTAAGAEALAEAQGLRARVASLETEYDRLEERRGRISELVAGVEERDRERQRLVDRLEATSVDSGDLGAFPALGIGLAPDVSVAAETTSPWEDDALFRDLMERDPRAARQMLFQADPDAYWQRFPLQPPARALRSAISFPRPDPVGRR